MSEPFRAVPNGTIRLTAATVAGLAPTLQGLPAGGGCTVLLQNRGTVPVLVEFGAKASMSLPVVPSDTAAGSRSIPVGGVTLVRLQMGERHIAVATASGTPDIEATVGDGGQDVFSVAASAQAQVFTEASGTPLAASATFSGATRDGGIVIPWTRFNVVAQSNQAGTLIVQGSNDGFTAIGIGVARQAVTVDVPVSISVPVVFRYYRVLFVNGTSAAVVYLYDSFTAA